mgnify:CR=1 FL=1
MNSLFFGDCLHVLRVLAAEHPQGLADLIYLDPPFNSKRDYSILFKSPKGHESHAQIEAFEDTWHWGKQAEREYDELFHQPNTAVSEMMYALRGFLGANDMMAYLVMMANRLLVMHDVLKDTGSLYLHCDPTASHYLKIVLDGVFGAENFRNEIIWQRTSSHNDSKRWAGVHDTILYYGKSKNGIWNPVFTSHNEEYLDSFYRYEDARGRYRLDHIIRSASMGPRPNLAYEYKGYTPEWGWRTLKEKLIVLDEDDRLFWSASGRPYLKRYLAEQKGSPIKSVITDIHPVGPQAQERLGYPTQKPIALLERIIQASSNPGGVVLDPFCGCGTAVHAAQKNGRQWIGIDITHLAISLIEKRLKDAFPGLKYEVHGTPKDIGGAAKLSEIDKYQFQWWACSLVGAQPFQGKKKGADSGIDGLIYFQDEKTEKKKIIVSVKGGDNVNVGMVRDLKGVIEREKAQIGIFVTLAPPSKPMTVEAVSAGYYESPHHGKYPKIQILTIEGLLSGRERPLYPDMSGGLTFKKAQREAGEAEQEALFE